MNNNLIAIILPTLGGGGVEKVYLNLAKALIQRGYNIHFVLLEEKGELLPFLPEGAFIFSLNRKRFRNSIFSLAKYLWRQKPNIILASMWPLTSVTVIAWMITGKLGKLFLAEHSNLTHAYIKSKREHLYYLELTIRLTYPFATGIVGVSKGVLEDIIHIGHLNRKNTKVIYNPVSKNDAKREKQYYEIPSFWNNCRYKILTVGRLTSEKDHKILLQAFSILVQDFDAKLIILGDGPLWDETRAYVKELGLEDLVDIPGFCSETESWYSHADLFVLSSKYEGLPTVLIEALEHGLPIVSTDCPSGPSEILSDGLYGTLVPVGNAEVLAEAMKKSIFQLTNKEELKRRALDFSIDKIAEEYIRFFES